MRSTTKILLLAAVLALGACSKVNQANFDKVHDGMSLQEVKSLLGDPNEISSAGIGPLSGTSAVWKASDGTTITISFLNEKVKLKSIEKQ